MDLRELGDKLRREREAQGLSVDEVIEKTKISRRNINAIEEGRRDDLPHPVYSKGFIRNYAGVLGLDSKDVEQTLTQVYPHEEEDDDLEATLSDVKKDIKLHSRSRKSGKKSGLALFALLILVSILGMLIWFMPSSSPVNAPSQQPPTPSESEPATPEPAPQEPVASAPLAETTGSAATPEPEPEAPAASENEPMADAEGPVAGTGPEAEVSDAGAPDETTPEAEPAPAARQAADETVVIAASEACWLEALYGDGTRKEYFLQSGERLTLNFAESLTVRLGNGGGVTVSYNGREVPIDVGSGQVKTLSFPPAEDDG